MERTTKIGYDGSYSGENLLSLRNGYILESKSVSNQNVYFRVRFIRITKTLKIKTSIDVTIISKTKPI